MSALIHSATMVCAGVYLIARSSFLLSHAPEVALATAIIGTITALVAADIALAEKTTLSAFWRIRPLAKSVLCLSHWASGRIGRPYFDLFTHAFFKSLLFLGAGSLIHALDGEQNLKHMAESAAKCQPRFV